MDDGGLPIRPRPFRPRIVVIDDEAVNLELLDKALTRAGFDDVVLLDDATRALDVIRTAAPDLVLLDLHMPYVDGYDVIRQVREAVRRDAYLPILVLTADITQEARDRALQLGANDFVVKPFDLSEVLLRMGNLLETRLLHLELQRRNADLRTQLDEQLVDRLREREGFVEQLVQAQETERARLAADIHDDSLQTLSALSIRLQLLSRKSFEPAHVAELDHAVEMIRSTSEKLRTLLFDLHPPSLDTGGLAVALRQQLDFVLAGGGPPIEFVDHIGADLPPAIALALFRVAQEAISNAVKHSGCTSLRVELHRDEDAAIVRVVDDGAGFDVDRAFTAPAPGHIGVRAMRERAHALGGSIRITSAEGAGTVVEAQVPLGVQAVGALGTLGTLGTVGTVGTVGNQRDWWAE